MSKKRIFALITSFALVATLAAPLASAMTEEEMRELIADLQEQVNILQGKIAALTGEPVETVPVFDHIPAGFTFETNLSLGSSGDDVKYLQIVLNADTATRLAASGVGSPGQETSYFGPLTQSAVIKFQEKYADEVLAPHDITAGTGFVGTTTRAKLNDLLLQAVEPIDPPVDEPDPDPDDPVDPDDPDVYGLEVSFSTANPASGDILVDSTAGWAETMRLMGAYDFSAGDEAYTVDAITFTRKGFTADGDVADLYLYADGELVSDFALNVSTRKFQFEDTAGLFTVPAGGTTEARLYMNIDDGVSVAQTVGFDIAAAADIDTNAPEVSGLPLIGSMMSAVDVTLAQLGVNVLATDAEDNRIGSSDIMLGEVRLTPNNNHVRVEDLTFSIIGTLSAGDLRNLKLVDLDDNVLASVTSMTTGKEIVFTDLGLTLESSKRLRIKGDIVGGPGRTFTIRFEEQKDARAYDVQYDARVGTSIGNAYSEETIQAGDFEMTLATDSPVGSVPLKDTNVVLASYDFVARGERIRVNELTINEFNAAGKTLNNVKILVDGSQRGSTKSTLVGNASHTFDFGNTFNIPLGETAAVEVVADLDDTNWGSADTLKLDGGDVEYRRMETNDTQTATLPDGLTLVMSEADVSVELSTDTPIASILAMGKTHEVGRWRIESEKEGIRLDRVLFDEDNGDLEDNVVQAVLKLYEGTTLRQTAIRSIYDTGKIVFGNTGLDNNYPGTSRLGWNLDSNKAYTLALELVVQDYADGQGADSGDELKIELEEIDYYTRQTHQTVAGEAVASTSNEHELRRAVLSIEKDDVLKTGQVPGINREVLNFTAAAESGARRATLNAFTLTITGVTQHYEGEGELRVHPGSTANPFAARLRNAPGANVANLFITRNVAPGEELLALKTADPGEELLALKNATPSENLLATRNVTPDNNQIDSVGNATGTNDRLTFNAAHGLDVGDVFKISTDGGAGTYELNVAVSNRESDVIVDVLLLDGSNSITAVNPTGGDNAGQGDFDFTFADDAREYVFVDDHDLIVGDVFRVYIGDTSTNVVVTDATGNADDPNHATAKTLAAGEPGAPDPGELVTAIGNFDFEVASDRIYVFEDDVSALEVGDVIQVHVGAALANVIVTETSYNGNDNQIKATGMDAAIPADAPDNVGIAAGDFTFEDGTDRIYVFADDVDGTLGNRDVIQVNVGGDLTDVIVTEVAHGDDNHIKATAMDETLPAAPTAFGTAIGDFNFTDGDARIYPMIADHDLSIGDVFRPDIGGSAINVIVVALGDAAGANTNDTVRALRLDGSAPAAPNAGQSSVSGGNAVFMGESTLYIPMTAPFRINAGTSQKFIVTSDTNDGGNLSTNDQVNVRIDSATDITWHDEAATVPFATARLRDFPVQWVLRY